MKAVALASLVALELSSGLSAQISNDLLGRREVSLRGPTGMLLLRSTHDATAASAILMDGSGATVATISLPMKHATGCFRSPGSAWSWIVCGMDFDSAGANRMGVVCRLAWSGAAFSVPQTSQLQSVWPVSIAIAPGGLAVLDGKARSIVSAPCQLSVGGPLPTDGQWTEVASSQTLPELATPGFLSYMSIDNDPGSLYLASGRGAVFSRRFTKTTGGGLQLSETLNREATLDALIANGNSGFDVWFPPSCVTAQIRDPNTLSVLATLSGAPGGWADTGALPFVVQDPGRKLEIYYPANEPYSHFIWPAVRYGAPLSVSELEVGRVVVEPLIEAGRPNNGVAMGVRRMVTGSTPVLCSLSLALRRPDGSDPVATGLGPNGQQALLAADASITFVVDAGQCVDNVGKLVSISGGSGVLLSQFIVVGANETGVSDVASTTIVDAGQSGLQTGGGSLMSPQSGGQSLTVTVAGTTYTLSGGSTATASTMTSPWMAACARFGVSPTGSGAGW